MDEKRTYQIMMEEIHASDELKKKIKLLGTAEAPTDQLFHEETLFRFFKIKNRKPIAVAAILVCFLTISNIVSYAAIGESWVTRLFHTSDEYSVDGDEKKMDFIPENFTYQDGESYTYYLMEDHSRREWNKTDSMLWLWKTTRENHSCFHSEDFDKELSNPNTSKEEREWILDLIESREAVIFHIYKEWKGTDGTISYDERVNPWIKSVTYQNVKTLEETTIRGNRAYLITMEDGRVEARIYGKAKIIEISVDLGSEIKARELLEEMTK